MHRRAVELVAGHDRPGHRHEDADALSFFSLNSPGYLAYFGPAQARRKVRWTLGRLSPQGRAWLRRLRPEVQALLGETGGA